MLYGGAKGGAKSYILRWWLVLFLLQCAARGLRNVRVMLAVLDYPQLKDMHISKVRSEFPEWLGTYHEQDYEFRLHTQHGGGVLCFRNLDDPHKYTGREYAAIAVDELTQSPRETFDILRSCLRWPGLAETRFAAGTNPTDVGLAWVRRLWIERDFSEGNDYKLDPDQFVFVPAKVEDNPYIDPSYMDELETLPEHLRRAYRDGDWYVFVGQFLPEIRPKLHIIRPHEIPNDWKRWRAVDYGTASPYCCLWLAQNPDNGRRVVYREHYGAGYTALQQAQHILRLSGSEPALFTNADPHMFDKGSDLNTSPADVYRAAGVPLRRASNKRVQGWNNVRQALEIQEDGLPGLQIFDTCVNLIRTIQLLVHDEKDPEDCRHDSPRIEDHAPDCLRYGLALSTDRVAGALQTRRPENPYGSSRLLAGVL